MEKGLDLRLPAASMGVTAGALTGLSVSPVVGGIISSLVAAGFVLLSLVPDSSKLHFTSSHLKSIPIFCFSLLAACAITLSLRINHTIFPSSIENDYTQLMKIGISKDEAIRIVSSRYLDGKSLIASYGIPASPETPAISRNQILRLSQHNYTMIHGVEALHKKYPEVIKDDDTAALVSSAGDFTFALKEIIETHAGPAAASIWYNLQLIPPQDEAKRTEMTIANAGAYQELLEYFTLDAR